jgi:hypothetical protein
MTTAIMTTAQQLNPESRTASIVDYTSLMYNKKAYRLHKGIWPTCPHMSPPPCPLLPTTTSPTTNPTSCTNTLTNSCCCLSCRLACNTSHLLHRRALPIYCNQRIITSSNMLYTAICIEPILIL